MVVFDAEDAVMNDGMDQKLLEKLCRDFKIDYKTHLKPGKDVIGNKLQNGDIVLVISPSTITKTRLIPAIVVKHTKVKTQGISTFCYDHEVWGPDVNGNWTKTGEVKTKHSSFYPEQIIKVDLDTVIKVKEAINKKS